MNTQINEEFIRSKRKNRSLRLVDKVQILIKYRTKNADRSIYSLSFCQNFVFTIVNKHFDSYSYLHVGFTDRFLEMWFFENQKYSPSEFYACQNFIVGF